LAASTAAAAPARPLGRAAAHRIPVAVSLAGIVVVSAAVQYLFARQARAPWIMVDELIYSELAKSLASSGHFLVRGHAELGYGVVYPTLISPAWVFSHSMPSAYAAAKAINVVAMSLTAVPAYFLARRLAGSSLALAAAALAVAVPSTLYAGTLMTENAFYPLFGCFVLALVRCVERPTRWGQLLLLALCGLAFMTRVQAVVLLLAAALAPPTLRAIQRRPWRWLLEFRLLYGSLVLAGAVAVIAGVVRSGSPLAVLGAYRVAGEHHYALVPAARWLVYHVAELDLYVGVVPLAAFAILVSLARRLDAAAQAFVAAALPLVVLLVLEVSVFATFPPVKRIEERNMFYVAPVLFTALVAWIARGAPRPPIPTALTALAGAALPGVIPYRSLIGVSAKSDTLALLLWWWLENHWIGVGSATAAAVLAAALLAALFLALPSRLALALPAVVFLYLGVMLAAAEYGRNGLRSASAGALFQGITARPDWVDRRLGGEAAVVTEIWSGHADVFTLWENEFFNRSIGPVLELGDSPGGGLAAGTIAPDRRTGLLRLRDGAAVRPEYALADVSVPLAGEELARDEGRGMVLFRVRGPLRETQLVDGLYDDGWAGRRLDYTRFRCTGGRLEATIQSDPRLFRRAQTVAVYTRRGRVAEATVLPFATETLLVPLSRDGSGRCLATFRIPRTAVPAQVQSASKDRRALGLRFLRFRYLPR
jgi:4-amino-4-deoxy-L-arabinose transferase-like glycosyltransferase